MDETLVHVAADEVVEYEVQVVLVALIDQLLDHVADL